MSFLAGLHFYPPSSAPARIVCVWFVAAAAFGLLGYLLRYLRNTGRAGLSYWIGGILLAAVGCCAALIEVEYWRALAEPALAASALSDGSDGVTIDHDGEIRFLIAIAAGMLPILLIATVATISGWIWPISLQRREGA